MIMLDLLLQVPAAILFLINYNTKFLLVCWYHYCNTLYCVLLYFYRKQGFLEFFSVYFSVVLSMMMFTKQSTKTLEFMSLVVIIIVHCVCRTTYEPFFGTFSFWLTLDFCVLIFFSPKNDLPFFRAQVTRNKK